MGERETEGVITDVVREYCLWYYRTPKAEEQ